MKAKIYDIKGNVKGEKELPAVFRTPYRPDVIKKAFLAFQSANRQPYGSDPLAGKRTSAHYHGSRHRRFTMMNREMSRMPRIHGKVGNLHFRGRFAPHAVKGRRAHPPKVGKIWELKMNKKEKLFAIRSALAATASLRLVKERGHITMQSPIILESDIENVKKTKEVAALLALLLDEEMQRCRKRKIRAGMGKMRNRRYRRKKGPLLIVSDDSLMKAGRNIAGVDVVTPSTLDIGHLAPGAQAGRLLVVTDAALEELGKL